MAWKNKGSVLGYLGRYSEARKALEKAESFGSEKAKEMLEYLDQEGL